MELGKHRVDVARVSAGEWVDDIPGMDDLRLKVRGSNSAQYKIAMSAAVRAVPRADRNRDGSIKPDVAERISGKVIAESVLLDWENLTIDGATVPYSKEKEVELLTDPQWQVFRDAVALASDIVAGARDDDEADTLGKSDAP